MGKIALIAVVLTLFLTHPSYAGRCINQFLPAPVFPDDLAEEEAQELPESIEEISSQILHSFGMARRVQVFADVPIANACAAVSGDGSNRRLIYVNSSWLEEVSGGDYWVKFGIIAHEIGHHVNNHTHEGDLNEYLRELEADTFAGRAVAIMGGTVEQALSMLKVFPEEGTNTHPAVQYRRTAISEGYKSGPQVQRARPSDRIQITGRGIIPDSLFVGAEPLVGSLDVESVLQFSLPMRERPLVQIKDATIDLTSSKFSNMVLSASTLELINSEIIIGKNDIGLVANKMLLENSAIRSGLENEGGGHGLASGDLFLIASEALAISDLTVALTGNSGRDGAVGETGRQGENGRNGIPGQVVKTKIPQFRGLEVRMEMVSTCIAPAQPGLPGRGGGPGGPGEDGQNGGDGGNLTVLLLSDSAQSVGLEQGEFNIFLAGGAGGSGGPGGPGGAGGLGGSPAPRNDACPGAPGGSAGPVGPMGPNGAQGQPGVDGRYTFRFVTPNEAFAELENFAE